MSGISVGPSCRRCRKNEQDCAWSYPCCDGCLHRFGEPPAAVSSADACDDPYSGTDTGYYRHRRKNGAKVCGACREAHNIAERNRARRKKAA
jgi:hypothetical protein